MIFARLTVGELQDLSDAVDQRAAEAEAAGDMALADRLAGRAADLRRQGRPMAAAAPIGRAPTRHERLITSIWPGAAA